MSYGLLWMDDDKQRPFEEKVKRAVRHFQGKYGTLPLRVEVNPGASAGARVGNTIVKPVRHVLPHHFFLVRGEGDNVPTGD